MTLQELLTSIGLDEATVTKVLNGMKENKIFTAGEENLDVRYGKLKTDHESKIAELKTANDLIAELKKGNAGNEQLQGKVSEYEQTITTLQTQLKEAQIEAAAQLALRDAKVVDPDYMMFKLKEKGALELDDNGKIKGIDDKIAGLKTQFPTQFESGSGAGSHVEEKKLPPDGSNGGGQGMTKAEFLKKPYAERAKFYQDNPEGYKQIMNG